MLVYQCVQDEWIEMEVIKRLRFRGTTFGGGLEDGKIYNIVGEEDGAYRVVDDSDEDYLYSIAAPGPADGNVPPGRWEEVE